MNKMKQYWQKILYESIISVQKKETDREGEHMERSSSHTRTATIQLIRTKCKGNMLCHATNANDLSLRHSPLPAKYKNGFLCGCFWISFTADGGFANT